MDTGNFIHVLITIVGIIGACAVALVCDMLKTNNERLREANLELQVRREEEQRRADLALEQLKRIAPLAGERSLPVPSGRSLAALEQAVGLAEPGGPPVQAGATMPEARLIAREFLEALSPRGPAERRSSESNAQEEAGETVAVAAASAPDPSPERSRGPRKNWELLLKGGAPRPAIDVTPVPAGRQRGELIPFESLQSSHPQPEPDKRGCRPALTASGD